MKVEDPYIKIAEWSVTIKGLLSKLKAGKIKAGDVMMDVVLIRREMQRYLNEAKESGYVHESKEVD